MQRALKTLIVTGAMAAVLAPVQARADGFFSPWVGSAFGAGNGISTANIDAGATTFGITAGGMGAGIIGGEIDFGYSPSFFGDKEVFGANSIINLMGNVVVGVPVGGQRGPGIRPYVTAGLGLLRTQIDGGNLGNSKSSDNGLGWNAGAGVMGYFADHVGVRGDLRYIRGFNESDFGIFDATNLGALRFWRASVGVVIR
jgi:outer membrane protein with beta-barrel domain